MSLTVQVIAVEGDGGSIAIGHGLMVEAPGLPVRFGGDWRPMLDIAEALDNGEEVIVEVEDWQILG